MLLIMNDLLQKVSNLNKSLDTILKPYFVGKLDIELRMCKKQIIDLITKLVKD